MEFVFPAWEHGGHQCQLRATTGTRCCSAGGRLQVVLELLVFHAVVLHCVSRCGKIEFIVFLKDNVNAAFLGTKEENPHHPAVVLGLVRRIEETCLVLLCRSEGS